MVFMKFTVLPMSGQRLDRYLTARDSSVSRSQMVKWIAEGRVTVDGRSVKPSLNLFGGEQIEIRPPEPVDSDLTPENIPLDVLHEDADLILLNKPAHLVVHPAAGHSTGTLTNALLAHSGKLSTIGGVHRPGIVHRLDKGTSGIMVIAKNDQAHRHLQQQFKDHTIKKIYWTVIWGKILPSKGTIKTKIARHATNRKKFAVHATSGKEAVTHYRILDSRNGVSLLEIELETGRTHQIRVHLSHLKHAIVGDPLYGRNRKIDAAIPDHPLLHARKLELIHPVTKKALKKTAPLPDDFKAFLKETGLKTPTVQKT